jgi:hypothetical protein
MRIQAIACVVLATSFARVSFAQTIRVLSEGANSTSIEVTPDFLRTDTIKVGGALYLNPSFRNAIPEAHSHGDYLKEFIPVMAGVFSKQIRVQVVRTDYQTRSMMRPVRSPRAASVLAPISASEFVSYDGPFEQRRHLISRIRVYPFLYDSLSGSYKILRRVVFQITSLGSGVTNQAVGADRLLSESLVNYSQVQNAIVSRGIPSIRGPNQLQKIQASSVLAQGPWYSIGISQSGIYKLTYQNLKGAKVPVDSIQLSTIRIFNNGGTELPEDPNAARLSDPDENAIYVYNGNTDGTDKFEAGDYILFYGKSPREWSYDPAAETYHHYLNHYTETNYYFLTYGGQSGKRMQSVPSYQASSYYIPSNFTCGIACDSELTNLQGSGKDWYGAELQPTLPTNEGSVAYPNALYGLDQTQSITYRAKFITRSDQTNSFTVSFTVSANGVQLGPPIYDGGVDITGPLSDTGPYADSVITPDYTGTGNLQGITDILSVTYSGPTNAQGYVDWFEILYKRKFQALNDVVNFRAPDTNAVVCDSIQGFSNNSVKIFDVTDFANVSMIQPASINNGTVSFGFQQTAGSPRQFFAVGDNGYLSVGNISQLQNSDLRSQLTGADVIIVTPPDFVSQANQLANFKQSFDGLRTIIVKTTDIYNEFSCGIPDPTAIRDYLEFAYVNFQQLPSYVIFFGAGSYDYKNRVSSLPEYVPAYESDESLDQVNSYSSDDYFVEFVGSLSVNPVSMSLGRLPVRSQQDADTIVNKIKQYEQNPSYGSWRNLVTFVGDDHESNKIDSTTTEFMYDSESLANNLSCTPPDLDRSKIYLGAYPTIVSTQGIRKPDAAGDLVNQINQGTLVLNFIGHGAPNVWSYTHIFDNAVTIPELTNLTALTLFVAATCDFGRDDDPVTQSGAELLLLSPQGGAIGVLSSTRVTYEGDNSALNSYFFQKLFVRDSLRNPSRIGDAFFALKENPPIYIDANDIKYNYIGDPTVRLALPKYQATVDSLNGKPLATQTQQIRALDKVDLKGAVYHPNMTVWNDFNGTALLTIYDSDKNIYIPSEDFTYVSQGSILFRGQVSVRNGLFESKAVIPKDISYSDTTGKIELYFQASGSDGSGYTRNITVGGTDTNVVNNHEPPTIKIYLDSRNFKDGDVVSANPTLIVDLHSENGINLSEAGVGHSLQATFDSQSVDLSSYYVGAIDSYQDGTVNFPVTMSLAPGEHSVTVSAFDVFNNSSEARATFDIESSQQLSLMNIYNYPDPFSSSTAFTFQRTAVGGAGEPVNVKIKVFTLSGRLIKTILSYGETDTFVKIPWDGLDDDGNRLANGVYLYKVIVSTLDGSQTSEAIGKMAVVR